MNHFSSPPRLRTHANYDRLVAVAAESHARSRNPFVAAPRDIALARLYCHAFRRQVIGAFHATRRALEGVVVTGAAAANVARAVESLADLADRSMDSVERDVRALIASFHHHDTHVARVVDALTQVGDLASATGASLAVSRDRFMGHMEAITAAKGLSLTRDDVVSPQGCFQVPNLGITIMPLVYGDHHSWNLAWLDGAKSAVPCHLHPEGVEIHLGYGPLHGHTILGDVKAEVTEGYAMPIPPGTRHGYANIGSRMHHVPFIFGSLTLGGSGVFLDVDARPTELVDLATVPVTSAALNGTVFLEREITAAAVTTETCRRTLIPASRTARADAGGIDLSLAAVVEEPLVLVADRFRAVSVVIGRGTLALAGEEVAVTPHDHFGIPAGLPATLRTDGGDPRVLLDAMIEPGNCAEWV